MSRAEVGATVREEVAAAAVGAAPAGRPDDLDGLEWSSLVSGPVERAWSTLGEADAEPPSCEVRARLAPAAPAAAAAAAPAPAAAPPVDDVEWRGVSCDALPVLLADEVEVRGRLLMASDSVRSSVGVWSTVKKPDGDVFSLCENRPMLRVRGGRAGGCVEGEREVRARRRRRRRGSVERAARCRGRGRSGCPRARASVSVLPVPPAPGRSLDLAQHSHRARNDVTGASQSRRRKAEFRSQARPPLPARLGQRRPTLAVGQPAPPSRGSSSAASALAAAGFLLPLANARSSYVRSDQLFL